MECPQTGKLPAGKAIDLAGLQKNRQEHVTQRQGAKKCSRTGWHTGRTYLPDVKIKSQEAGEITTGAGRYINPFGQKFLLPLGMADDIIVS